MRRTLSPWQLWLLIPLVLGAVLPAAAASRPDARLYGDWQLDAAASDDFEAKLKHMAEELLARRRSQRSAWGAFPGSSGAGADGTDPSATGDPYGQVPGLSMELPPENQEELRDRLAGTYRPPSRLHIRAMGSEIGMLGDTPPERRFNLDETVTRMDVSGTAQLRTSWSGSTLLVDSRYTNRARSEQRFSLDRSGEVLTVTVLLTEPNGGRLQLHTAYRRVAQPPSP